MPFTIDKAVPGFKRVNAAPPGGMWKLARLSCPGAQTVTYHKPPPRIAGLLDADYILAVDVETHDWVAREKGDKCQGGYGKYGFYFMCNPEDLSYARIIQIGWSMGRVGDLPTKKEYLVKPLDFRVSAKAQKCHGISQEHALSMGKPLREVLQELIVDLRLCAQHGGRVVAHQIEFRALCLFASFLLRVGVFCIVRRPQMRTGSMEASSPMNFAALGLKKTSKHGTGPLQQGCAQWILKLGVGYVNVSVRTLVPRTRRSR